MININKKKIKKNLAAIEMAFVLCFESSTAPYNYVNADNLYLTNYRYEQLNNNEYNLDNIDNYVLQGITIVDGYRYITAYDYLENNKSKIIILDSNNNFIKEKYLNNYSHVGGITFDDKHNIFWITDSNGTISGYDKNSIINNNDEVILPKYNKENVGNDLINYYGLKSVAYITYYDNKLYVGNFNNSDNTFMKCFNINDDGSIDYDNVKVSRLTGNIQGISFYNKDNNTYFITSSSNGRYLDSNISIYKYRGDNNDYREDKFVDLELPPMIEQIDFYKDKLISIYESNSKKYKTMFNKDPSDIIETSAYKLIKSVDYNIK